MKFTLRTLLAVCSLALAGTTLAEGKVVDPSTFVTTHISVTGAVEHSLNLSVDDLRKFPPQQIGEVPLVCQSGANMGKLENFKGVLLRDILDKAKVKAPAHNDVKKMAVIASASDGYKVVFSWTEIFNSPRHVRLVVA